MRRLQERMEAALSAAGFATRADVIALGNRLEYLAARVDELAATVAARTEPSTTRRPKRAKR